VAAARNVRAAAGNAGGSGFSLLGDVVDWCWRAA
jgi:hypothetical protein